jgi:deoxyribose-phosphate aldolase
MLKDEIKALVEVAETIPAKVILEVYYLTLDDIKRACD